MFTGIIEEVSKVKSILPTKEGILVSFDLPKNWKLKLGESININGVCSTVYSKKVREFSVIYMKETLKVTTFSYLKEGDHVNLERSLRLGDILSGHFVYGHIDILGIIKVVRNDPSDRVLRVIIPKDFLKFVVYKGSVALDGVSLTISKVGKNYFEVSLIPFTIKHTNLGKLINNDKVNVEMDILGKYILNYAKNRK